MPEWRICTIKVFSLLVLQNVLQTYLCAYFGGRTSIVEFCKLYDKAWLVPLGIWLLCILIVSSCGSRLKDYKGFYIPLYLICCIAKISAILLICSDGTLKTEHLIVYFAMKTSCYSALSFYACCMKKQFTILWSHVCSLLMLLCTLGTAVAIYQTDYMTYVSGAGVIGLITSYVIFSTISILDEMKKN